MILFDGVAIVVATDKSLAMDFSSADKVTLEYISSDTNIDRLNGRREFVRFGMSSLRNIRLSYSTSLVFVTFKSRSLLLDK